MANILLIILVTLFALNMGGSNFGASFATTQGGRILSKKKAQILFVIFVFLGAIFVGQPVTQTLGNRIIPVDLIDVKIVLIILFSATLSVLIANLLHVPQSTSLVTVASIVGVGFYFKSIYTHIFFYLIPFWIILPILGYVLTYFLGKLVYPPRKNNFWIYEKLVNHRTRLRSFVIIASCYNAFSVGTNNVANAVGPLVGANIIDKTWGLILIAPIFGLGSIVFHGPLKTTSERIVPLGLFSATIICFVSGTLIIIASVMGVPQSFVMIKVASILAISGLKNGHRSTFANPVTKKTYLTWAITPIIAIVLSFILTGVRYALFN
jgi:sulfate permease